MSFDSSSRRDSAVRAQKTQSTATSTATRLLPHFFSNNSTPAVQDSAWCSGDFMLGAGMVIIQPSSGKLVLLYENLSKYWFLPKGRKDLGESLEQTALREAYEESGYKVEFLPLYIVSNAPVPPNSPPDAHIGPNTEPIYITTYAWPPRKRRGWRDNGGEYITTWYVGQIPEDAVREEGTGMPNERHYSSHLVSIQEAREKLPPPECWVVEYAWKTWMRTLSIEREMHAREVSNDADQTSPST